MPGTYTYANGDVYAGDFENDVKHGKGVYIVKAYPSQFDGQWVNGQLATGSSWHLADGSAYTGDFANNAPARNGAWRFANGGVQHGAHVQLHKAAGSEETVSAWRVGAAV